MDNAQSNYENDWDPLKRVFFLIYFLKKNLIFLYFSKHFNMLILKIIFF